METYKIDDTVCGYSAKDDTVNVCGYQAKILQSKVSGMYYASFFANHATMCIELHKVAGFEMIAKKHHAIDYDIVQFFPKFNTRSDLFDFVDEINAMYNSGIDKVLDRGAICGIPIPDLAGEDDQEFTSITSAELSQDLTAQYVDSLNDFLTTLTPSNYANRLQESKTSIRRGDCPKGRKISSRKDKVAIGIGRLSYRKCHS